MACHLFTRTPDRTRLMMRIHPAPALRRIWSLGALFTVVALTPAFGGPALSSAAAQSPAWQIVSTTNPTNLQQESPRDEVQKIAVNATGGTFMVTVATPLCEGGAQKQTTVPIVYNATAVEVQAALEALSCEIAPGSVAVSGGPGGSAPYVVTFLGSEALGNRPIPLMEADGAALSGSAAKVTVTEAARGAYAPELNSIATNVGGASTNGGTVTFSDSLPAGVIPTSVSGYDSYASGSASDGFAAAPMSCSTPPTLTCTYSGKVTSGDTLVIRMQLKVEAGISGDVVNRARVSGGGLAEAEAGSAIAISGVPAAFGPAPESVIAAVSTDQAGAHPDVTTAFTMDTSESGVPAADPKDIRFNLPPGLVGSAVGMPQCTMANVLRQSEEAEACPSDTMVGMATLSLSLAGSGNPPLDLVTPVYNIAPAPGEPVAFAFDAIIMPVRLDTSVLSDGNYGVRVTAPGLSEAVGLLSSWVTIWGVPADHDGPGEDRSFFGGSFGGPGPGQSRVPLLTNPSQCSEPLSATMETDAWTNQGVFVSSPAVSMGALTGCNQLSIEPSFSMVPDTLEAGAPAGYSFDLRVPQSTGPDQLSTPNAKGVKLTLPAGTVVNPSAAWGLKACSNTQFFGSGPREQQPAQPGNCPREAQVGKVRIKTPALEEQLEGEVYLAEPECDPCTPQDAGDGKMVRLFLQVVSEGEGGIVVKLEGHGEIDQGTGQITTTFENDPQLPFDKLELTLGGGPRAVLANPRVCRLETSDLDLTPWSSPFTSDSTPFYEFEVNQGCFGPQFHPSFVAGSPNIQAGEYSPFTLSFGRSDQDEFLNGITLKMPPGLLGNIGSVVQCKEPEASQGTCGEASLIGHTQVLTGPGADPFLVSGGKVFLTEGYEGAPYGLSIVVPAVAGPYTLSGTTGKGTVVVRAKIQVDPITAALTVTSDPLPSMLDGIPLQLKVVDVTIDKPDFTFNPTNCGKLTIGASLSSVEGMSANVASPFQVTNCATRAFKPTFKVSTSGKTSRANGASLSVKLAYPKAPFGTQANIRSVRVDLPKQLPSRLSTLQKACTDEVFESNPAACPEASRVGTAKVVTPILPVPLTGPAYFVGHGGAKFPELVIVLQGYGVTVQLHGETFISKAGITSSTFRTVPDVPVGTFELTLPQEPYSALAANANLCAPTKTVTVKQKETIKVDGRKKTVTRKVKQTKPESLVMPTAFVAQNGAEIHENTAISVTGCAKAKPAKKKAKKQKKGKQGSKKK